MTFKAYTDYPIIGDGDHSIRQVDAVAYDRDKYARIVFNGEYYEVKIGYIFADAQLKRRFSKYAWYSLPIEIDGEYPTRKEVHDTVKAEYRRKKVEYIVSRLHPTTLRYTEKIFRNLHKALAYASAIKNTTDVDVERIILSGFSYHSQGILCIEDGYGVRYDSRGYPPVLTTKTLKPYGLH